MNNISAIRSEVYKLNKKLNKRANHCQRPGLPRTVTSSTNRASHALLIHKAFNIFNLVRKSARQNFELDIQTRDPLPRHQALVIIGTCSVSMYCQHNAKLTVERFSQNLNYCSAQHSFCAIQTTKSAVNNETALYSWKESIKLLKILFSK